LIDLDNNATTRPLPEVVAAVRRVLEEHWANPSSVHRAGQAARREVELARRSVATLIGAGPKEIVFTSGATESIDLAIRGVLAARGDAPATVITTPIEHEAVREVCNATSEASGGRVRVRMLPVGREGVVDAAALGPMLDATSAIVSVQWANNETGAVQPIERIGAMCRERGVVLHTDATQWIGKMPCDVSALPIDLLSLSGHKFHGIKGSGALYVRRGVRLRPVLRGTQELDRRGGTENVPGIAAMGAAAEAAMAWLADAGHRERGADHRDAFESAVLEGVPGAVVNGPRERAMRLWNTTNIGFPRLEAEALLLLLSERGVCASAGAACSSGSLDPSPVLLAMGVPPEVAHGSLRFSLSRLTTRDEIDRAAAVVIECARKLAGSSTHATA
jgi:cysteine desulfurase